MAFCKTCHGFKTINCPICNGQGKKSGKECPSCKGAKKLVCPKCGGTGKE